MAARSGIGGVLLGAAVGLTAGYTAVRAVQMRADFKQPAPERPRDAKRYGDARRTQIIDESAELQLEDLIADEQVASIGYRIG